MNKENNEPWRDWEVEDWEHDMWKTRLHKFDFWNQTKEERAKEQSKGAYLQLIIEEGERGEFRKTWMEIIEERSAARKLMKEREKEEDNEMRSRMNLGSVRRKNLRCPEIRKK